LLAREAPFGREVCLRRVKCLFETMAHFTSLCAKCNISRGEAALHLLRSSKLH